MSIKRTIITTIVALALVAVVAPAVTSATTVADLMAQIAALQSQLQGLSGTTTATGTGACAGVTFTRNLKVGDTGSDVKCLQVLLNNNGYKVATTGAGSPGYETLTFGPKTLVAVKAFQTAKGMVPANQVGPMTRAALNALLGTATGTPGTPVVLPTGPVSAMVASDSPAAGAIVKNQASAGMLNIAFVGSGTVSSVTLQRSGISDQNTLTNVYLYDGATRITDGYSFNVSGQIVINGLSIAVNGSKTISVKADVYNPTTLDSSTIAIALTGFTANGTAVSANVQGNTMSIVAGNLASVYLPTQASVAVPSANVNAGTTGYTFWSAPLQVNTRAVMLKVASFRMIGSAPSDALSNIKLFIDGVDTGKIATVTSINGSNYAMFDLTSAPISLTTGSHTMDVRANVEKGTNRNITMSVQQASDLTIFDPQVGVNIAPTTSSTVAFSSNSAGTITILTGSATVTVDPTFTSQTNVTSGATNAVIGRFKIHAYGEDLKINTLNVTPSVLDGVAGTCTTNASTGVATNVCGLTNVTLYFNGSQVGSQVNYAAASYTMGTVATGTAIQYSLGSQMIVPAGQDSTLEVRADIQTTGNIAYTQGTIAVRIASGASANAQGQSSQNTTFIPGGTVAGTQDTTGLTISSATLVVSKNSALASYTAAPNATNVKIGSYVLQNQSTSEAVRLTSLTVGMYDGSGVLLTSSSTPALTNFSSLRTSDTTGSGSTPVQPTGTNTFSVTDVLQPGASMVIDIFANTASATSTTFSTKLTVASIGVVSNIADSDANGIQTGQTISLGSGEVANPPTLVVSSTTPAQYIAAAGGATNAAQATFNFISTSSASTITELKFAVSGTDATPSQTVTNVCVGTICAQPVAGVADLTGLSLNVPVGGGLTQNVQISYAAVGIGGITPGKIAQVSLTYVKYTSGGTTANFSPNVAAPMLTLVGSKPTVTVSSTPASGLILGAQNKIGEVTVAADAKGAIKMTTITFTVGNSGFGSAGSALAITDTPGTTPFLALHGQSTQITGSSCDIASTTVTCTLNTTNTYATDFLIAAGQSQTFDLFATTGGAAASGSTASVSTSVTAAGFVWADTSTNGAAGSRGLTGDLIYGFPSNSYTIHQ